MLKNEIPSFSNQLTVKDVVFFLVSFYAFGEVTLIFRKCSFWLTLTE